VSTRDPANSLPLGDTIEVESDDGFAQRAAHRRLTAWTRVGTLSDTSSDDSDERAATPDERVVLVDVLTMIVVRAGAPDGRLPRLRRSATPLYRRER